MSRVINILDAPAFSAANKMLKVMIGKFLSQKSCSEPSSRRVLEKEDLVRLNEYFDRSTPVRLQDEVFFKLCYHFGFRGREWIRDLETIDIIFKTDGTGRDFVDLNRAKLSKNVRPGETSTSFTDVKVIVMYADPLLGIKCPVEALRTYLKKIPPLTKSLFPKSKTKFSGEGIWYCDKSVLGKNTLATFMKGISSRAALSKSYTNHCIRATVVCELKEKGVPLEDIQLVTGHKRPDSVARYVKRVSDSKKRKLSDFLHDSMNEDPLPGAKTSPGAVLLEVEDKPAVREPPVSEGQVQNVVAQDPMVLDEAMPDECLDLPVAEGCRPEDLPLEVAENQPYYRGMEISNDLRVECHTSITPGEQKKIFSPAEGKPSSLFSGCSFSNCTFNF